MDPTREFARLARSTAPPLDRLALLVAAHARPGLDLDAELGRLDALAGEFPGGDADALRRWMWEVPRFRGNVADYYDPDNSMLDQVLRRRRGIPITLSVVMMEIGRRRGVELVGVSMPGEFLVRERHDPAAFHNPFRGGRLDQAGVAHLFERLHGPGSRFDPALVAEVGPHDIVARMLANLAGIAARRSDTVAMTWVLRLRTLLPDASVADHRRLVGLLDGAGRFWEAAEVLDRLARIDAAGSAEYRVAAARRRSRLN